MLRVWTKLYNAFNTGQISVLGSAMWGCGETERQKLNNLISSPLFTSSSPLHFLISSHFLTFVSLPSLLSCSWPSLPQISSHIPPCCAHLFSSPIISSLLYPISSIHSPLVLLPLSYTHRHLFSTLYFLICLCIPISRSAYIFKMCIILNSLTGNIETLIVKCTKTQSLY